MTGTITSVVGTADRISVYVTPDGTTDVMEFNCPASEAKKWHVGRKVELVLKAVRG